jgi:MFS family permease
MLSKGSKYGFKNHCKGDLIVLIKKNYFKWLVLVAIGFGSIVSGANTLGMAPILGDVAHDLAISVPTAQASFLGIFVFVVSIATLISGALADRFGLMPVLILATVVSIVPNLLYPFIGHIYGFVVFGRVLQGFAAGASFSLIPLCAAQWFSERERGIVIGIGMSVLNAGMAAGLIFVPMMYEIVGNWRSSMAWLGIAQMLFVAYILFIAYNYKANDSTHTASQPDCAETSSWGSLKGALQNPTTYIGIVMCFLISWLLNALNDLTPQYFALPVPMGVGFGRMRAGELMLTVQIGQILGGLVGGFVMDKIFKSNPKPVLVLGFILAALTIYPIMFPVVYNNAPVLMTTLFISGLAVAFLNPAAGVFITQAYPESIVGRVVGLWLGIGAFGGAAGVFASALALHATGTYHLTINLFACVGIVGLILASLLKKNINCNCNSPVSQSAVNR